MLSTQVSLEGGTWTWKKAYVYFLFIFFRGLEVLQEGQRCCGVAIYIYTSKCAGLFTV